MGPVWGPILYGFWAQFWGPNPRQNEPTWLQKPSQGATIAKRSDFEKCCFVLVFTAFLEHLASQESLKTAKKPPKVPPDGHQEPFQKRVHFLTPLWSPKLPQNLLQNCSKSGPNSCPKNDSKTKQTWTSFGPQNGPQNPSNPRRGRTVISGRGFPEGSWSQEAPRMPQDGPEEVKIASN